LDLRFCDWARLLTKQYGLLPLVSGGQQVKITTQPRLNSFRRLITRDSKCHTGRRSRWDV